MAAGSRNQTSDSAAPPTYEGRTPTISSSGVLSRDGNSFGLIRLVLSCSVIISHSWTIGRFGVEPLASLSRGSVTLGSLGVSCFFALSGVLVGRSAERLPPGMYLWHRCRRILPGYWVCLIVTAFGFGSLIALVRGLPTATLWQPANETATTFVTRNFTLEIGQYRIGSVLDGLPFPDAVNGSLWSLIYEFACYLMVLAVIRVWILSGRRHSVLAAITALAVAMAIIVEMAPDTEAGFITFPLLGTMDAYRFFTLWAVFMVGALVGLFASRIPFTPPLVALAGVFCVVTFPLGWFQVTGALVLPYLLIGIAYYLPRQTRKIGTSWDLSYGLYLYGFPVGQLLVAAGISGSAPLLAFASILATAPVAALSWFAAERPMLHLGGATWSRLLPKSRKSSDGFPDG